MNEVLTFRSLHGELLSYFGQRLDLQSYSPTTQTFVGVLYEALAIRGVVDPETGVVSLTILIGNGRAVDGAAAGPFVSVGDAESVRAVLRAVDEACRLRLPDAFLAISDVPFDTRPRHLQPRNARPGAPALSYAELYGVAVEFFGARLSFPTSDEGNRTMTGVLYDSFLFSCGYDERVTIFYAGVQIGQAGLARKFLGRSPSMNTDRESILESLKLVDDYCRLRLPSKYLDVSDDSYKASSAVWES